MKIALFGQNFKEEYIPILEKIISVLTKNNIEIFVEDSYALEIKKIITLNAEVSIVKNINSSKIDTLISIGGDGTMLRAASLVSNSEIPLLGINTGRLGFLATVNSNEIELQLNKLIAGQFTFSNRSIISISASPKIEDENFLNFALNEVTVSRKDTTSMISIETTIDNEYLTTYWADGLIVATPTGSTGYSLSCGGPVVSPNADCFVITPIAPHNLNARPLILKDDSVVKLKVNGREEQNLVSLDSRIISVPNGTEITISKAPFRIKLIEFENESFLKTLREKLLWGEDKRN